MNNRHFESNSGLPVSDLCENEAYDSSAQKIKCSEIRGHQGACVLTAKEVEIAPLVKVDIDARIEKGRKEYGGPLTTADGGRDNLQDAYEEALDLALYLKKELLKRG